MSLLVLLSLLTANDFLPVRLLEIGSEGKFPNRQDSQGKFADCVTTVRSIVGESEMVVEVQTWVKSEKTERYLILLKGAPTKGLVDDVGVSITGRWKVTGTKMLPLVGGGTRTVFVVEPAPKP